MAEPVTDPALLKQLNGPVPQAKPVTDPALLKQLNGPVPQAKPVTDPTLLKQLNGQTAQPLAADAGSYHRFFEMLLTPEGRSKAWSAVKQEPGRIIEGIVGAPKQLIESATKPVAADETQTLEQARDKAEVGPAFNVASLLTLKDTPTRSIAAASAQAKEALRPVEKILSPQTVSPEAEQAAGTIRSAGGTAVRDTASTAAALEPYHRVVNALPEADRLSFIDRVEGGRAASVAEPLRPLADVLKKAFDDRRAKLEALPSTSEAQFVDEYYPHFWKDPKAAEAFLSQREAPVARPGATVSELKPEDAVRPRPGGGYGRQGSRASLNKRTVPTIAEGIRAGLVPLTTNPIEATMRYVTSMDRFIASQSVLDAAKANGTIRYVRPRTMGASGHPEGARVPPGWVKLEGRGATDKTGAQAYAPEDWAGVYNNFISRGFHEFGADIGNAMDALQRSSNAITGLELGLSGYHAMNIAVSSIASDIGRGVSNIAGGRPLKGLTALGRAFAAPVTSYLRGRKLEQVYLGRTPGTPDWRRVIDVATQGGIRGVGKRQAPDYSFSAMGSYWTAWKRGALKQEAREAWQNAKDRPVVGATKELFRLVGRTMETISKPLFEDYIPRVKNAAVYDLLRDWMEANPAATHDEQVRMARRISDAMDDRFGEMINDNIFWNKALKQIAQIVMRSYSWTLGLFRQMGKAVSDPRRLSIKHPDYNPSLAGVIGTAVAIPTINAIYQYLKTGQPPQEERDLIAPRTGGQVPGFGGKGTVPERAMLPSHERDIFGWYFNPAQEAANKQARLLQMIEEGVTGKDSAKRYYVDPDASAERQVEQWLWHLVQGLEPISLGTLAQGHKQGSTLGWPAAALGVREASKNLEDPEGVEQGMAKIRRENYKRGQKSIRKQENQYGGPQE